MTDVTPLEIANNQNLKPLTSKRVYALDALRGLAILAMILSGTIPFDGSLPAWMYHAQVPPPDYKFNPNLPGLTWVDLVFPLFIFTLGAAIPLAYARRLERGQTVGQVISAIFKRGFFLVSFAIASQHFRPLVISDEPGKAKWALGLLGFALLFLMFVRLPSKVPKGVRRAIAISGWLAAAIVLANLQYPSTAKYPGFSLYRSDIILLVLANLSVFASLIWLFTRRHPGLRLGLLVLLFPLLLSFKTGGWNSQFLKIPALDWLFNFDYLKYLFIALPATLVGDGMVTGLMQEENRETRRWNRGRCWGIAGVAIALNFILLIGLQARWLVATAIFSLLGYALGYPLLREPGSDTEKLIQKIYLWAGYGLALGLAFEPYEGGIKKDSATMSYFAITTAMSMLILIALLVAIELLQQRRGWQLAIDNGKNPLLAYVAFGNFLWPLLELSGAQNFIVNHTQTSGLGLLRGLTYTAAVALCVSLCTRLQFFWKS